MTAQLALADVDLTAILIAGMAALGITGTVSHAAPTVCGCLEVTCDGDHLWVVPEQPAGRDRAGGAA